MQTKIEVLEELLTNVQNTRDLDETSVELTEELNRIEEDITKAILQERLNQAFEKDQSHIKRLSQN